MAKKYGIRRQRPLKGGRTYMFVALHPFDALLVEDAARKFRVSRSWAASVMVADNNGNDEQETFLPMPKSGVRPKLSDNMHGRNGKKR
jgi:hypothetical protein